MTEMDEEMAGKRMVGRPRPGRQTADSRTSFNDCVVQRSGKSPRDSRRPLLCASSVSGVKPRVPAQEYS
ncbi:hypothetical protein HCJ93_09040 [Streptomyces sp. SBST2-5]|uniref:Uncharacterized protein n=1 Tax=Streptomyces composti TaxID=2720025 RepID=A0ABX1A6H9_9ACTN|nr:hypothetical protein [Streptomyces composti]NJP50214.1 hypothetical protein [Streptomyces composti]